jgi:hypothetical protein
MSTTASQDIVKAVRSGELSEVMVLLESGIGRQRPADLGLGLAMASFLGYREIARELVRYGAPLNLPAGLADASPLAMSIKGKQAKTTRMLISLGALIPPGLDTLLTDEELNEAQDIARRRAAASKKKLNTEDAARVPDAPSQSPDIAAERRASANLPQTTTPAPGSHLTATPPVAPRLNSDTFGALEFTHSSAYVAPPTPPAILAPKPPPASKRSRGGVVEEIEMTGCYGVDTNVLESELMRWNATDSDYSNESQALNAPELDLDKKR